MPGLDIYGVKNFYIGGVNLQTKAKRSASRLLAILLVLTLCLGLLPAVALAEDGFTQVTSADEITDGGNFVLVANTTAGYKALGTQIGSKIDGVDVSVSGSQLSGANIPVWTVAASDTGVSFTNGSNYLGYGSSGTNFTKPSSPYTWNITKNEDGTFRFNASGSSNRIISWQNEGGRFGAYSASNTSGYVFDLLVFKSSSVVTQTVAAPQANPQAGQVTDGTQITLTCATSGASIYYTLDGTEPTSSSTLYSDSSKPTITGNVGTEVTLKAIAARDEVSSVVQTLKYTIKAESEAPIADGDTVVIYNPAYNKALSSERTSAGNFYNKGVNVTLIDSTLSGYGDTEIWTVTDNKDGTWSFSNGGKNIGMDDQYTSMPQGGKNDKWVLEDAGDGCWYIKNTVRDAYIEWYERNNNWSAYYPIDSGSEDLFKLKFYKTEGSSEPDPGTTASLVETPSEGDIVLIYYPADGKAMSTEAYNYNNKKEELVAIDATVTDNTMTVPAGAAQFKVYKQDGHYVFKSDAGFLYLDGTNVRLAESMDEYTLFDLEETDNGWFVKSVNASFNGKAQYLEFYRGYFTCYGMNSGNTGIYTFQFSSPERLTRRTIL